MVILAFIGGFQKGVTKIFGLLSAIIFGGIVILWSAPYLADFLTASVTQVPFWLMPTLLFLEFVVMILIFMRLLRSTTKPKTKSGNSFLQNTMGGLFLSAFMLFSIAILSGFFEQTNVIKDKTRTTSVAYQLLHPVKQKSWHLWQRLTDQSESESFGMKAARVDG